jgi:lipopolysaccharide/colanic/teichoic acid biosynthesis glycosyltransferase
MAVVGPRPERPFVKNFRSNVFWDQTYYKPGLTGWAQVNYSYGASIDDSLIKLQYDLYYIKHRSFYLDLNIALKPLQRYYSTEDSNKVMVQGNSKYNSNFKNNYF